MSTRAVEPAADPQLTGQPPLPTDRRRWLAMPFIALGVAMIIVDATIVNVAVPTIIRDLHVTATTAEWFNTIYALVFASLLISLGHAGDVWGRRRLFFAGTVVFVAASLVAATAPSGSVLILGRFIQGIGGAMILPATLSTVNATFFGRDRAVAFAIWGSTIGGVAALGPLLGGWLTTDYSWRWAFLINVPIGAAVLAGIVFMVPETRDPQVRHGVDWFGNVLAVVGLGTLVFALIEGQHYGWWRQVARFEVLGVRWPGGWLSPAALALAVALVALPLFVVVERRRAAAGRVVLVDLRLFGIRSFAAGNVAALVVALGEFGLLFVLPLFLQGVLGYTALETGYLFLALALGTFVAGGLTPQLARRIGARGVARTGLALEAVGIIALGVSLSPTVGAWVMVPWLFVYGLGVGMATAQLTGVILTDVPVADSGQASGIQSTSRQLGSALGIAVLGTVLLTQLASRTADALSRLATVPESTADQVVRLVRASGGAAIGSLHHLPDGARIAHAASVAAVDATRVVAFVAAGFILIGLLATLALPAATADEDPARSADDVRPPSPR